ncbi:hypothetical protein C2845_PM07G15330 [Panicum miliaceum]|uniref:Uncharacterized protein n=1 Tax=Panicum miliaceum TaxID=4540 RepID=A0A3L6SNE9_PANMI|nr:hypothetical protein C2845_PM07G15330 [Panicum miliaceum]
MSTRATCLPPGATLPPLARRTTSCSGRTAITPCTSYDVLLVHSGIRRWLTLACVRGAARADRDTSTVMVMP